MESLMAPPLGKKAIKRLQRRRALLQRFQALADEEHVVDFSTSTSSIHASTFPKRASLRAAKLEFSASSYPKARGTNLSSIFSTFMKHDTKRPSNVRLQNHKCTFLSPLHETEEDLLERKYGCNDNEVIVHLTNSNIRLRASTFRRLKGNSWLDDEIINGFVGLINRRSQQISIHRRKGVHENVPRTYMFSSFFYKRLSCSTKDESYADLRRWTVKAKVNIQQYDLLLFPVHVANSHWVLCTIDLLEKEFTYLDPLHGGDHYQVIRRLRNWLAAEFQYENKKTRANEYALTNWKVRENLYRVRRTIKPTLDENSTTGLIPSRTLCKILTKNSHVDIRKIPEQRDGSSCGVFSLKFADCLSMGHAIYFRQRDIPLLREKIALDLIRNSLPLNT